MTATSIRPASVVRRVSQEQGEQRLAEIVATLDQMGLTVAQARAHRDEYRLTERQWLLVRELDSLEWLLQG